MHHFEAICDSNWNYSPETLNSGQNQQFLSRLTSKFDGWPWKTIGHLFYATACFVHHFKVICEFKMELQLQTCGWVYMGFACCKSSQDFTHELANWLTCDVAGHGCGGGGGGSCWRHILCARVWNMKRCSNAGVTWRNWDEGIWHQRPLHGIRPQRHPEWPVHTDLQHQLLK